MQYHTQLQPEDRVPPGHGSDYEFDQEFVCFFDHMFVPDYDCECGQSAARWRYNHRPAANCGGGAEDVSQADDMEGEDDGQEDLEEARLEVRQEEVQKMLTCGAVSKNLMTGWKYLLLPAPNLSII